MSGLIDLHSHLLPGIDDGCRDVADSLACVRALLAHGFGGTICTPHMAVNAFPDNTPAAIATRVAELREELQRAGLAYSLWAGGELRIAEHTLSWLKKHGVPTLGPSRKVLIDYWGRHWPACAADLVAHLIEEGYQPILAHPERMDFEDHDWHAALDQVEKQGAWLQGNLRCLAGNEGRRVGQRALQLLRANRYRLLATDMHGSTDLVERLAGLAVVEQQAGAEALQHLLAAGPGAIAAGE